MVYGELNIRGKTMTPKVDIVTQDEAKDSIILIGIQVGIWGYVIRLGLYRK